MMSGVMEESVQVLDNRKWGIGLKIRYAIEKEVEVPDNFSEDMIDEIIKTKCEEEQGFDYVWQTADEPGGLFSNMYDD